MNQPKIATMALVHKKDTTKDCPDTITLAQGNVKQALLKLGDAAYILFHELLIVAENPFCDVSNEHLASRLGWTETKVQKAKDKLIKTKWYSEELGTATDGRGKSKRTRPMIMATIGFVYGEEGRKERRLTRFFLVHDEVACEEEEDE